MNRRNFVEISKKNCNLWHPCRLGEKGPEIQKVSSSSKVDYLDLVFAAVKGQKGTFTEWKDLEKSLEGSDLYSFAKPKNLAVAVFLKLQLLDSCEWISGFSKFSEKLLQFSAFVMRNAFSFEWFTDKDLLHVPIFEQIPQHITLHLWLRWRLSLSKEFWSELHK